MTEAAAATGLPPVRVLHLFANHKVTGPAELALETARALDARPSVSASFLSSDVRRTKHRDRWLQRLARERKVPEPALRGVRLGKHLNPLRAWLDARRLGAHLAGDPPDLLHCHLPNDHLVAASAVRHAGLKTPIVRTIYDDEPPGAGRRVRWTLGTAARLVVLSRRVAEAMRAQAAELGIDPRVVVAHDPPIDTTRFDPARGVRPRRQELGLAPGQPCIGIVARMQTHRRYEVLLEAIQRVRASRPDARLVVVGRGTKQDEVARDPVESLGLSETVTFAGHLQNDDFVGTLAAFDVKVFLVPGSDGTCRAVREALAMGVPVVASRLGMLPELVRHEETGLLLPGEEPEAGPLAGAILRLLDDASLRGRLGRAAREDAVRRFSFTTFAERLEALYREVLAEPV